VLIEFAIIAFIFTLLLAAVLTFGLLLHGANVIHQAADVGAMEFARSPAGPTEEFQTALQSSGLYQEADLVLLPGTDPRTLPLINQLLYPVYIYDPDINRVRYPGTLVTNGDGDQTVLIPIVGSRDPSTGAETISEWRLVVEEVKSNDNGPYSIVAEDPANPNFMPGMVALRINYPYQSGAMVAYMQQDGDGAFVLPAETLGRDNLVNIPVQARDGSVTENATLPPGYTLVSPSPNPTFGASPHRGTYGLGEAQALRYTVRPYRKVLTAQAVYRREVFE
jgi:hypothetical protein